ncbi:MarR family winged helix-turn-helix transcriptional regulator [Streptomyces sp. NPDC059076]|uniref:MarR family winged helix-turn-helix transcriptional regulator n=1 Tax=unclassified Streptomyces TaxID=2593676 RepID=UPI0036B485FA
MTTSLSDTQPATQSIAHWTGLAHEALISFIRARQVEHGFTQPQFWLLRNLSKHDISPDGNGMTLPELQGAMRSYIRPEDDLATEADVLLERGWLSRDDTGRLWITEAGEAARKDLKRHSPAIGARIHEGIDDADYATTVKVLQRMIHNTSGTPG